MLEKINEELKGFWTVLGVAVASFVINVLGSYIVGFFELPLWMDSFGTMLAAYLVGPLVGAIVGATTNIVLSLMHNSTSFMYAIVSISIAVMVGLARKRQYMVDFQSFLHVGVQIALVNAVLTTPITIFFNHADAGNYWENGVIHMFRNDFGFSVLGAVFIGEFSIDFLDKLITMIFLYAFISHYRPSALAEQKIKIDREFGRTAVRLSIVEAGLLLLLGAHNLIYGLPAHDSVIYKLYLISVVVVFIFWVAWFLLSRTVHRELKQQDRLEKQLRDEYALKISSIENELTQMNLDESGVLTRRALVGEMKKQMLRMPTGTYTVFMVDMDNLKYINDHYGHPMGDLCISRLAEALQFCFRKDDLIGRIGGDEFMVFCGTMDMQVAKQKAQQIVRKVNETVIDAEADFRMGCSIGCVTKEDGAYTFEEIYVKADEALYQAKRNGKNKAFFMSA